MREVEKSEGNYMSRERPIGNLGDRTEATNRQTNKRSDENFVPSCDFSQRRKKAKKKCAVFITHARCLRYFLLLLLLLL